MQKNTQRKQKWLTKPNECFSTIPIDIFTAVDRSIYFSEKEHLFNSIEHIHTLGPVYIHIIHTFALKWAIDFGRRTVWVDFFRSKRDREQRQRLKNKLEGWNWKLFLKAVSILFFDLSSSGKCLYKFSCCTY